VQNRRKNHGPDAGWDRIDGWWNLGGSIERFGHEPWSQEKDFGLKKNTSRQVRGEVCLDGADVVIDGMWAGTIAFTHITNLILLQFYVTRS